MTRAAVGYAARPTGSRNGSEGNSQNFMDPREVAASLERKSASRASNPERDEKQDVNHSLINKTGVIAVKPEVFRKRAPQCASRSDFPLLTEQSLVQ
jgi:hypothetical protein